MKISWEYHVCLLSTLFNLNSIVTNTLRISRVNKYLYDSKGDRFYIKGIAFHKAGNQNTPSADEKRRGGSQELADSSDPILDLSTCQQAIKRFKELNINTIRIFSYNAPKDHSPCMNALEKAGIYVIADISLPNEGSINQNAPSWDVSLLSKYITQIDSLRRFPNLLAFNIGNEIITNENKIAVAPYIKAAARDVKRYLKAVKSSALVAYASIDGAKLPAFLAQYVSCDVVEEGLDLFGLNNYRWCGNSDFKSAYEEVHQQFKDLQIAAYFSEFGCIDVKPRVWTEVNAIFSEPMSDTWSGGSAFSYFPTSEGYGILDPSLGNKLEVTPDFENLAAQYRKAKGPNTPRMADIKKASKNPCFAGSPNSFTMPIILPPEPNVDACNCVEEKAFSCQVRPDASPAVMDELLGVSCSILSEPAKLGATKTCNSLASNPAKGTYGILSACNLVTKLNYAMTLNYLNKDFNKQACDFGGNATVKDSGPIKSSGEVDEIAQKCFLTFAENGLARNNQFYGRGAKVATINGTDLQNSITGTSKRSSKSHSSKDSVNLVILGFCLNLLFIAQTFQQEK
ncbi:Glucanosyltransferase-domain-containing protein [Phakopsora pachyrhizi]|uniref:1,3-beta-glucanosyltransferase n=1 Tax=Phakopsora pachyrhizi TaxID=170000 RepID=A0AAV0AY42_PHAPC|nr:Glucanosyltransferase-domain-containing protein [Phakopsora pachyrhizi]KAI8447690.1 Glucanosyltransferase-domain-containing protein [Phakopsora pachyrhizi]CAH7675334.1 Glucanosyltransferase-domain-containing protein [Phakopsora pachyrhizi]